MLPAPSSSLRRGGERREKGEEEGAYKNLPDPPFPGLWVSGQENVGSLSQNGLLFHREARGGDREEGDRSRRLTNEKME